MKPSNPMAQLQQWKANHQQAAINRFVNEMNRAATNKSDKNCETDRQFEKLQNVNLLSTQKTQREAQKQPETTERNTLPKVRLSVPKKSGAHKAAPTTAQTYTGNKQGKHPIAQYSANMAQMSRQFELANIATAFCKLNYPENYHFKTQFAKECDRLRADLKGGKHLLMDLISQFNVTLNSEQRAQFQAFKNAVGYMNQQLKGSARYVDLIATTAPEDLPELVSRAERKREALTTHQTTEIEA